MRRLLVIVALLGVAVGSAACTTSPPAATVDGTAITQATLDSQLSTIVGNADAACVFSSVFMPSGGSLSGAGQDTVTSSVAAAELGDLVLERLLDRDLAAHHQAVTAAEVAAAEVDLRTAVDATLSAAEQSGALPPACSSLSADPVGSLPSAYRTDVTRFLALQEQFRALVGHVDLSTAGVARYYVTHQSSFQQACLNLVVADTQAAAQAIDAAIAGGESFAAAATGAGADTTITPQGGQVPCQLPSVISSTFGSADAAVIYAASAGQLLAPMSFTLASTGTVYWLVVKVVSLPEAPLAQVASTIRQQLLSGTDVAATDGLRRLVARAQVSVDPTYGSWDGRVGLVPPTPPPAADVLNPAADETLALLRP